MTMLSRRKRSSADKADTAKAGPEEADGVADDAQTEQAQTEQVAEADDAQTEPDSAEEESPAAASGAGSEPAGRSRRVPIRVGMPLLIVLAVVSALLVAAVVGLWIKRGQLEATNEASDQAVHAASEAARDLSSYDYRTLESDFKTASTQTTGSLHSEYDALAQQIRATAIQQQAVSQTTVIKAGVESGTADRVTVIVFANRSATTTSSPNRLPESLRIRMTMVKVSGRWLASDLQVL